jgi:K+-sensing histidine kinase KdpD
MRPRDFTIALAAVAAVTWVLLLAGPLANTTTVALCLVIVVLFVARNLSGAAALIASVASVLAYNFFFLPPVGTFTIADPDNWIALTAFIAVATTVGELSARAKLRADEAESSRREVERLYAELRDAFERAADAEALRRSDQLKSALLDAVTHELRTPLTSIKASTSALLEAASELDTAARRELLEIVDEEADRLDRVIGDLVAVAKIEAGAGLQTAWCSLDDVARAASRRAGRVADPGRISIVADAELPVVKADPRAIEEALSQLLQNALRVSPSGSVVTLTLSANDDDAEIRVDDEGPGVPPEARERIFQKFNRGDGGRAGTLGLGLAIARGIVNAHGGQITVQDRPDGRPGASFVMRLPIGDDGAV